MRPVDGHGFSLRKEFRAALLRLMRPVFARGHAAHRLLARCLMRCLEWREDEAWLECAECDLAPECALLERAIRMHTAERSRTRARMVALETSIGRDCLAIPQPVWLSSADELITSGYDQKNVETAKTSP